MILQVYEDSLGKIAENYGPLSKQTERKLRVLDRHIKNFLDRLHEVSMTDFVNVVIVSDHGMTYGSQPQASSHPPHFPVEEYDIKKIQLGTALEQVRDKVQMVVGSGAYSMVYPQNELDTVNIANSLRRSMAGSNVEVCIGYEGCPEMTLL